MSIYTASGFFPVLKQPYTLFPSRFDISGNVSDRGFRITSICLNLLSVINNEKKNSELRVKNMLRHGLPCKKTTRFFDTVATYFYLQNVVVRYLLCRPSNANVIFYKCCSIVCQKPYCNADTSAPAHTTHTCPKQYCILMLKSELNGFWHQFIVLRWKFIGYPDICFRTNNNSEEECKIQFIKL